MFSPISLLQFVLNPKANGVRFISEDFAFVQEVHSQHVSNSPER